MFVNSADRIKQPPTNRPSPGPSLTRALPGATGADALTGTVTLLVTDIVGSTGIARTMGDSGYAEVLRRHNELIRTICEHSGAHEVAFTGDGFIFAFGSARQAALSALEMTRSVADDPVLCAAQVTLRIGLHTGEVVIAPETGPVGVAVHTAIEISDQAESGVPLCSDLTAALLASDGRFEFEAGPHGRTALRWSSATTARRARAVTRNFTASSAA